MKKLLEKIFSRLAVFIALAWSLYQLVASSPLLPQQSFQGLAIHFGFAFLLCFINFSPFRKDLFIPARIINVILAIIGCLCLYYTYLHIDRLIGDRETAVLIDWLPAIIGITLVLVCMAHMFEKPIPFFGLIVLALLFPVIFSFAESKEESISDIIFYIWYSNDGIFSNPLKMSNSTIFIFMLFSVLLVRIGTIHYFSLVSFYSLRRFLGNSAKSLILTSALGGAIYGPDVSGKPHLENLPPELRDEFVTENAKLTDSSAKIFSQILPPLMGVGAFLIIDYANTTYMQVLKAAIIPSILLVIISLYLIHQSGLKFIAKSIGNENYVKIFANLIFSGCIILIMVVLAGVAYLAVLVFNKFLPEIPLQNAFSYFVIIYVLLIWLESTFPEMESYEIMLDKKRYPRLRNVVISGLHTLLPVIFLTISLGFSEENPQSSAFFSTILVIIMLLTKKTLRSIFRREKRNIRTNFKEGIAATADGLKSTAISMVPVVITLAFAGMMIEVISLTGTGEMIARIIENNSYESLIICIIYTLLLCLLAGAKLDITIAFILISYICTPVLLNVAFLNNYNLTMLTVNLFIFFCCVITACFAPLMDISISRKGGIGSVRMSGKVNYESLKYACCFLIIPVIFILNPNLLLSNEKSFFHAAFIFGQSLIGSVIILSAFNRYLLIRNTKIEAIVLAIIGLSILYPKFWIDTFFPPYKMSDGNKIIELAEENPSGSRMLMVAEGTDDIGETRKFNFQITLGKGYSGEERLKSYGLKIDYNSDPYSILDVIQGSKAENDGVGPGFRIMRAGIENKQPWKFLTFIPAILLLGLIFYLQIHRARKNHKNK